jgi:hypothetical protein
VTERDVDVAWGRACDGLGVERGSRLSVDEASVLLKYVIAERTCVQAAAQAGCARRRSRTVLRQWIDDGLAALAPALEEGVVAAVEEALRDDVYAERILDLVVCDLASEPMAPEVCLEVAPRAALPEDGSHHVHAVIFHHAPLVLHELYPLVADACVSDARRGGPRVRVVGVHGDWIHEGRARRAVFYDGERDRFEEAPLLDALAFDSAQFLALGERQTQRHRCWEAALACPVLNTAAAAAAADDKDLVRRTWADEGLPVPPGILLAAGERAAAQAWLEEHGAVVVKPLDRTEGDHVLCLSREAEGAARRLDAHLSACWEWGPALLEHRCDGVGWRDPDTDRVHSLVLRLHVAYDGHRHVAESGYALVGADDCGPATRAGGGRTLPLRSALESLVQRQDGTPLDGGSLRLDDVRRLVERAAAALPGPLGLAGIDVVLDLEEGCIRPVLLELNPRPAGLAHARFLPGAGEERETAGVSLAMWEGLAECGRTTAEVTDGT